MAVVGDEVMLCENGSEGTVLIYNRELEYVRQAHEDIWDRLLAYLQTATGTSISLTMASV